jgi:hypothetical protein
MNKGLVTRETLATGNAMTLSDSDQERDKAVANGPASVAEELQRQSEKLRQLAEELKAREEAQAEMLANYPSFKHFVYAALRERFERELPPLPDMNLETYAAQEEALPLEGFIGDLEQPTEGP